jgi:hypothetical protein
MLNYIYANLLNNDDSLIQVLIRLLNFEGDVLDARNDTNRLLEQNTTIVNALLTMMCYVHVIEIRGTLFF